MAVVLLARDVADGYRVRLSVVGIEHTLHFVSQPAAEDQAEAIKQLEQRITDEVAETQVVESDDLYDYQTQEIV